MRTAMARFSLALLCTLLEALIVIYMWEDPPSTRSLPSSSLIYALQITFPLSYFFFTAIAWFRRTCKG